MFSSTVTLSKPNLSPAQLKMSWQQFDHLKLHIRPHTSIVSRRAHDQLSRLTHIYRTCM